MVQKHPDTLNEIKGVMSTIGHKWEEYEVPTNAHESQKKEVYEASFDGSPPAPPIPPHRKSLR